MLTVTKHQQDTPAAAQPRGSMLDEIVREGARRMLAAALEAEVAAYVAGTPTSLMSTADGWWCVTGATRPVRC